MRNRDVDDLPIRNLSDLVRALDHVADEEDHEIRSVALAKHPDGSPRRMVVSFKSTWEPDVRPEL